MVPLSADRASRTYWSSAQDRGLAESVAYPRVKPYAEVASQICWSADGSEQLLDQRAVAAGHGIEIARREIGIEAVQPCGKSVEPAFGHVSARQRRLRCPDGTHTGKGRGQSGQRLFCKTAIGRDLAAEDRQ